jgi:DNA-binding CsgD family transcriptional regulator
MNLLERDQLLADLQSHLQAATAGPGALVFIEGEAGIGKTALLRAFAEGQLGKLPVRWGACDALQTPRPLAPLHDIAAQIGGELAASLESEPDRVRVFGVFLEALGAKPSLVLVEDLHWADEATLDLLRYVSRRLARTRSLVVCTFRSDELGPAHPLRALLGDLATSGVPRLAPQPLSVAAVRRLAGDRALDVDELHRITAGNPFFVTEVLAAGGGVPVTVRDAVLARAARLGDSARAVLDAAAVAGPRVEPWLLHDLAAAESNAVEQCLATGVLRVDAGLFVFRHELARQSILQALTPTRLLTLHRFVLEALQSQRAAPVDLARLAHHAENAGISDAVLQLAPAAAREAASRGAHLQASQQHARALRHAPRSGPLRAELLDDYAAECQMSALMDEAIESRREAAALWREAGDTERQAISLARLAHVLVVAGRNVPGEAAMREALAMVDPKAETAAALATRRWGAYVRMLDRDVQDAIREGQRALEIAERLHDEEAAVHCLNTIGSSMIVAGRVESGLEHLEASRERAQKLQSDFWVSNALGNLGTACGEAYRFDLAEGYLARGIEYCIERDIDYARLYQLSWLALTHMYRGRWAQAGTAAHEVLANRRSPGIARMMALIAMGRVRARRGDPGLWEALDEARALAAQTATLQRVAPMRAARAEAAWLEARAEDASTEAAPGIELAVRKRHAWFAAELSYWARAAVPEFCTGNPFALEAAGAWRQAADAWRALGCPFEQARALSQGDEAAQREALAIFESLGARPMVERVRHKLRAAGVRGLRRGPHDSTQRHPAGLTSKEVAVLELLVQGLRSKEIGRRMHRSARTVDHHLAAIFAKLGVANRAEAVSAAYQLGVVQAGDRDEPR